MDAIEKMDKIRFIDRYLQGFTEDQYNTINKLSAKIADEAFKSLCEEYEVCNVCGKPLDPNACLTIKERYPSTLFREIRIKACSDKLCEYNKLLANELEIRSMY